MMRPDGKKKFEKVEDIITNIIMWLELILALFILGAVILSCKDIVSLIYKVFITEALDSYSILQGLLSHVLLLVVGLELALMLIKHNPGSVLEVMLYAISRKMLVSSSTTVELLLGVIALGLIFLIDKYLHTKDTEK
ncbi:MAG: hypothetical protein KZY61_07710 [Clostridiaceae bacterium]|uniref:hypothetical protein n=1 Tax=Anaerosalibacter bizertensis TaxID=932217 RepID=UPI001D008E35|nr:hypothetical protein [Anaerosalibacter bizertensis]MBV1820630.1 hypothetical protein [Bacteroidales bacterium MSK.15.36]MBW4827254.1 hypothetical protein [Clostridiaceae bacterium]MBW4859565.1 hypothetical protein [Clostridiaceae bacterium]MBW4868534.1 hypothetical protein [Clostridiaceae bacterium]MCB5558676.1 hypothetical protein [Anaerosalibacter bizertensis]